MIRISEGFVKGIVNGPNSDILTPWWLCALLIHPMYIIPDEMIEKKERGERES